MTQTSPDSPSGVVLVRGGGDLGSGVVVALVRAGYPVMVVDRALPTCLRLTVALAAAALGEPVTVGGVRGVHAATPEGVLAILQRGEVPVWTGGEARLRETLPVEVLVDARLRGLSQPSVSIKEARTVIALGPGYRVGEHAHLVIETNRGPGLGRVLTEGEASLHTGVPGDVLGHSEERLLRAPVEGEVERVLEIGAFVEAGDVVARVAGREVRARIPGMVRGLKLDGVRVGERHKIGDVDPRRDRSLLAAPSDKAARIGEGVLEALRRVGVAPP